MNQMPGQVVSEMIGEMVEDGALKEMEYFGLVNVNLAQYLSGPKNFR